MVNPQCGSALGLLLAFSWHIEQFMVFFFSVVNSETPTLDIPQLSEVAGKGELLELLQLFRLGLIRFQYVEIMGLNPTLMPRSSH